MGHHGCWCACLGSSGPQGWGLCPPGQVPPVAGGCLWVQGWPRSSHPHSPPRAGVGQVSATCLAGPWLRGAFREVGACTVRVQAHSQHQGCWSSVCAATAAAQGGWVFSQTLALTHSPREKWEVSDVPSPFLLPLLLWVHSPREPLPKALVRGQEELRMPWRQQGLQGQQLWGLFGLCRAMPQGTLTVPCLSPRRDRRMGRGAPAMLGATCETCVGCGAPRKKPGCLHRG